MSEADDLWQYFGVASQPPREKQAWVRDEYEQCRCAYPDCAVHPSFGYGPPFVSQQTWTCREHQAWFEETQGKPRSEDTSTGEADAWIESVMAPIRQQYAQTTQPQVRSAAEAHRQEKSE